MTSLYESPLHPARQSQRSQYKEPHRIRRAPQTHVCAISEVCVSDQLSVPRYTGQNAQDVPAFYELTGDTVVPDDPVFSVRHDLQDAVQDIRPSAGHPFSSEKDCIERPIRVSLLNYHDVFPLSNERKHADPYVSVSQLPASFQFFFKCSVRIHTTHVPLFVTGNAKAFLPH